jgi:probable lipoprotein NlpC
MRIEPDLWYPQLYARAGALVDLLRHPVTEYAKLNPQEKDAVRQSQAEANEVLRVLGYHQDHALVMKFDQVLGWVTRDAIMLDDRLCRFQEPVSAQLSAAEFFQAWQGTAYLWGGVTRQGIDCSGLTQRFFLDVLGRRIPKNTYEQRRAGRAKSSAEMNSYDLVFCTRIGGRGVHHVGIHVEDEIWHAHGERGVIRQALSEFVAQYQVLQVVDLSGQACCTA